MSPDLRTVVTGHQDGPVRVRSLDAVHDLRGRSAQLACAYAGGGLDEPAWRRYVAGLPFVDSCR